MKSNTKSDAFKAIQIISILAVLAVAVFIAVTLAGYVGYPLGDANLFLATVGVVLAVAGGGLILYPTPRTTGVGVALLVVGGFVLVELMFIMMA